MAVTVEIVQKDAIKPSSPTPCHLKIFKFSFIDQLLTCSYAPLVMFYPGSRDTTGKVNMLKKSLSMTLTHFYMLAGKMKDDLSIDCNDEGAYFAEAKVNTCLNEFLSQPDLLLLQKFLPCAGVLKGPVEETFVANFQVNVFECGGLAIGVCISHKILDGAALATFIKAWSSVVENLILPDFTAYSLFPANDDDLWLRDFANAMRAPLIKPGKCVTTRFVFDSSAIAKLKKSLKSASRVEAVSALLWKCVISASTKKHGFIRPSVISHRVNLRKRMVPALSGNSIGNFLWIASAKCTDGHEPELYDLVSEMKDGISNIDNEFVNKLRRDGNERNSMIENSLKDLRGLKLDETDYIHFTSWCKLGFYDADVGWGKPVWISSVGIEAPLAMNLVILTDTSCGEGIEAWVTMDEPDMNTLLRDEDLVLLASVNPSPLDTRASLENEILANRPV